MEFDLTLCCATQVPRELSPVTLRIFVIQTWVAAAAEVFEELCALIMAAPSPPSILPLSFFSLHSDCSFMSDPLMGPYLA